MSGSQAPRPRAGSRSGAQAQPLLGPVRTLLCAVRPRLTLGCRLTQGSKGPGSCPDPRTQVPRETKWRKKTRFWRGTVRLAKGALGRCSPRLAGQGRSGEVLPTPSGRAKPRALGTSVSLPTASDPRLSKHALPHRHSSRVRSPAGNGPLAGCDSQGARGPGCWRLPAGHGGW